MPIWGRKKQTLATLVQPHLSQLHRLAYRLSGNAADAEDLVQELMLKLAEKEYDLGSFEYQGAWLKKVLYRLYLDHLRKQKKNPLYLVEELDASDSNEILDQIEDSALCPEGHLNQDRFFIKLENAMCQLPDQQRVLIALRDVEGYSMEEIQAIQDIPMGTLKSRLHRAREKLMSNLKKDGTPANKPALLRVGVNK